MPFPEAYGSFDQVYVAGRWREVSPRRKPIRFMTTSSSASPHAFTTDHRVTVQPVPRAYPMDARLLLPAATESVGG